MQVLLGEIHPFPNARADEEQAAKILEEAAEVFSAWQGYDECLREKENGNLLNEWAFELYRNDLLNECADLITACCNLRAGCVMPYQNPYMNNRALSRVDRIPLAKHCVRGILRAASLVDSATDSYVCARREYGAESEQTYHAIDRLLTQILGCISKTCGIIAAIGVEDFTPYMQFCEARNRGRGRYE